MTASGYSKDDFVRFWGKGGYTEAFEAYPPNSLESIEQTLNVYFDKSHAAMEIGCGSGFWTKNYLSPNFRVVHALDILPQEEMSFPGNVRYQELSDRDYECTGVADSSIDFVFSFGVFCHLPNSALRSYLASIYRKLKPGSNGLIMFADFNRHFRYSKVHFDNEAEIIRNPKLQDQHREGKSFGGWFWCDMLTISRTVASSPFKTFNDVTPEGFRDCLITVSK
jgi:SAM-dependent methyltransferase